MLPTWTILVVEDEEPLRKLVTTILTRAGFTIFETDNVKTALDIARRDDVELDLVVTDVVMPSGSGLVLVRQFFVEWPDVKCIVMSGHDEQMLLAATEPALDIRFLQKPFTPAQLLESVRGVLSATRRASEQGSLGN